MLIGSVEGTDMYSDIMQSSMTVKQCFDRQGIQIDSFYLYLIKLFRLEKTLKIMKSNCKSNADSSTTKPCH